LKNNNMAIFSYKATDYNGKIVKGFLEATDDKGVVTKLDSMGYIPIRITLAGVEKRKYQLDVSDVFSSIFKRVSGKDVMLFTQDLATLLEAGLPVDKSLAILTEVTEKDKFKEIIQDILKTVQGGSYLSDALSKYPRIFSKFYVNMIRAGEAGGILEPVLVRLGMFLETSQDLKDYIVSAMVYPIFLVLVGGISIIVLLTFVIPKFSLIFADLGAAIPFSTQLLLGLSSFIRSYWWVMTTSLFLLYYLFWRYSRTPEGKLNIDKQKVRLPILGDLIKKVEVARFSRTLGTLIRSGVPILQSITLVKDIIGNRVIAASMDDIREKVQKGDRLSKPLSSSGYFPSLAIQMITVGEETGRLDEMLLKVAEHYEKIVRSSVKRFIGLLEPAMILIMGLLVGFIVISMLMAIFSINEIPF
jgi:type II secretion system protein F